MTDAESGAERTSPSARRPPLQPWTRAEARLARARSATCSRAQAAIASLAASATCPCTPVGSSRGSPSTLRPMPRLR